MTYGPEGITICDPDGDVVFRMGRALDQDVKDLAKVTRTPPIYYGPDHGQVH